MIDFDGQAYVIDKGVQRFYYLTDAQWISYTIINGHTCITGCYSVPPNWTLGQMIDMLEALKAAVVEAYPEVKFLAGYPGGKSRLLAQAMLTVAIQSHSYQIYCDREEVEDPEAFLDAFFDDDEVGAGNPWRCTGHGEGTPRIGAALALTTEALPAMVRYYAIEDGELVSESTTKPATGPFHCSMNLIDRFATHTITVDAEGNLHYEPRE